MLGVRGLLGHLNDMELLLRLLFTASVRTGSLAHFLPLLHRLDFIQNAIIFSLIKIIALLNLHAVKPLYCMKEENCKPLCLCLFCDND